MFKDIVFRHLNIELSDWQIKQFEKYYQILIEYNKHTNLTAIVKEEDVYVKHFLDSLYLCKGYNFSKETTFCDIGAGAGFPSIPIKIVFPHIDLTIVDSLGKRIAFLNELSQELKLENVHFIHERAEVFAQANIQKFDVVSARAVGHLRMILEMGVPMLKTRGHFIAMKSHKIYEELEESKYAIDVLKLKRSQMVEYQLPNNQDMRYIIVFEKEKHVTGYPRSFVNMKKKPL